MPKLKYQGDSWPREYEGDLPIAAMSRMVLITWELCGPIRHIAGAIWSKARTELFWLLIPGRIGNKIMLHLDVYSSVKV